MLVSLEQLLDSISFDPPKENHLRTTTWQKQFNLGYVLRLLER
jgi:hypothetical protein